MVHMMSNIKVTLQRGLGKSRKKEDVELASQELVGIRLGTWRNYSLKVTNTAKQCLSLTACLYHFHKTGCKPQRLLITTSAVHAFHKYIRFLNCLTKPTPHQQLFLLVPTPTCHAQQSTNRIQLHKGGSHYSDSQPLLLDRSWSCDCNS